VNDFGGCGVAKILLIDDNDEMRRTLRRVLEQGEHEVLEASNGRIGVQLFREHAPALVITDILMPEQEGIETILEIRRIAPSTRIVAISGSQALGRIDFLDAAQQLGADLTLRKPIRATELLKAVAGLLADR
jgi:two-component system, chemotaxis family, chemotaxis protein CheY